MRGLSIVDPALTALFPPVETVAREDFESYTAGAGLSGLTGGTAWNGAWSGSAGATVWAGSGGQAGKVVAGNCVRRFTLPTWSKLRLVARIAWGRRVEGSSSNFWDGDQGHCFSIGFGAGLGSLGRVSGTSLAMSVFAHDALSIAANATVGGMGTYLNKNEAGSNGGSTYPSPYFRLPTIADGDGFGVVVCELRRAGSVFGFSALLGGYTDVDALLCSREEAAALASAATPSKTGYTWHTWSDWTVSNYAANGPFDSVHILSPVGTGTLLADSFSVYHLA